MERVIKNFTIAFGLINILSSIALFVVGIFYLQIIVPLGVLYIFIAIIILLMALCFWISIIRHLNESNKSVRFGVAVLLFYSLVVGILYLIWNPYSYTSHVVRGYSDIYTNNTNKSFYTVVEENKKLSNDEIIRLLKGFNDLKNSGAITEDEYEKKKKEILNGNANISFEENTSKNEIDECKFHVGDKVRFTSDLRVSPYDPRVFPKGTRGIVRAMYGGKICVVVFENNRNEEFRLEEKDVEKIENISTKEMLLEKENMIGKSAKELSLSDVKINIDMLVINGITFNADFLGIYDLLITPNEIVFTLAGTRYVVFRDNSEQANILCDFLKKYKK